MDKANFDIVPHIWNLFDGNCVITAIDIQLGQ